MAAKAIKESLIRHYRKRRCIFMMKRTAAPIAVALALERHIALHHTQNIRLGTNLFHKFIHSRAAHTQKPLTTPI